MCNYVVVAGVNAEIDFPMIAEAVREWFGPRCPNFQEDCAACQAWNQFDRMAISVMGCAENPFKNVN